MRRTSNGLPAWAGVWLAAASLGPASTAHAGSSAYSSLDLAGFEFRLDGFDQSVEYFGIATTPLGGFGGMKGGFGEQHWPPDTRWQTRPPLGALGEQFGPEDPLDPTVPYEIALTNGPVEAEATPPPGYSYFGMDAQGFLLFRNYDPDRTATITMSWHVSYTLVTDGVFSSASIDVRAYAKDEEGGLLMDRSLLTRRVVNGQDERNRIGSDVPNVLGLTFTLPKATSTIDSHGVERITPSLAFFAAEARNEAIAAVPEPSTLALLSAAGAIGAVRLAVGKSGSAARRRCVARPAV